MTYLADVNVWLALTFQKHEHYPRASSWLAALRDQCLFCRMTQQGFLRLVSNPQAFGADAVSLSEAWRIYDGFLADPRVDFASEPAGIEAPWRALTSSQDFSPKVWNDAYLVAFASGIGAELITFDKGFIRYQGSAIQILS